MKLKNRVLSAIMALAMCMSFAATSAFAADGAISLKASASEVAIGDTFTVEVNVDTNPGHVMLFLPLTFNKDVVTLTAATDEKVYTNGTFAKDLTSYPYILNWQNEVADEDLTATGKVATLTFTAIAAGDAEIEVSTDTASTMNFDLDSVDFGTASATITVAAPAPSTTPVEIAPVTEYEKSAKFEKDGAEYYHAAFTRDITVSATNDPVKGIELKGDKDPVKVTFNTAITSEDTTVKVAINILNVPADATLGTITITPFAN